MDFKLWSELNLKIKKELKPDLDFRSWDSLNEDEKNKIWKYLNLYFLIVLHINSVGKMQVLKFLGFILQCTH